MTTANITNKAWLLVRSNPARKDSIHYTFSDAALLQAKLAHGSTKVNPEGERTEIHELVIDRNVCGISVVSSDFTASMGPDV